MGFGGEMGGSLRLRFAAVRKGAVIAAVGALASASLAISVHPASASATATASAGSISELAWANLGKHACARNSKGGTGFESSCTGNGGRPEYWCADFAKWVWAREGVAYTDELNPLAGSFYSYGLENGTLSAWPAVGDAAVFNYYGGGEAEHVAIVTKVNPDGTIETVSGDWGGWGSTEASWASHSKVTLNSPSYPGELGAYPAPMGMTVSAFIAPVGVRIDPVVGRSVLEAGQALSVGESLDSPGSSFQLRLESNGDLVEYAGGRKVWSAGPRAPRTSAAYAQVKWGGDLVVYDSVGRSLWSTGTGGHVRRNYRLSIDEKGAVVLSGPSGTVLWRRAAPNTERLSTGVTLEAGQQLISANGVFVLALWRDGDLVETTADRIVWTSRTSGHRGAFAQVQPDGNFVLYSAKNRAIWSSRTGGHTSGRFHLVLEDTGQLDLFGTTGLIWSNRASA